MDSRFEQPMPPEESAPEAEETQAIERPAPPEEATEGTKTAELREETDLNAVRKALDTLESDLEFNAFFKRYDDSAEFNLAKNSREFFARYETFKTKKEAEQKLGGLYIKDLEQALNLPLSEEGGKVLSEFLDKEARENPEGLKERLSQIKNYEKFKKRKEELESQVDKLFSKDRETRGDKSIKGQRKRTSRIDRESPLVCRLAGTN